MSDALQTLFEPKSISLVGASELTGEDAIYSTHFHYLVQNVSSYRKGKIHLVDLSGKLEGSFKSINNLRTGLDLALVLLPEKLLTRNLQKLLSRQPRAMVIMESELREAEELIKAAKRKKMTIIGPGSIGIVNTQNGLSAISEKASILRGHVAIVSQDSCIARSVLNFAAVTGISKLINIGDSLGTDESEVLSYLSQDKETKVICIYLKRIRNGRKFVETMAATVAKKPVIVLSSYPDNRGIFEAAVKQSGGILVQDLQEMLNGATALAKQPPLPGERVAIIANVSGPAELLEKYLSKMGMAPAQPSMETLEKIKEKHPGAELFGFVHLGRSAKGDIWKQAAELLLSDKEVDGLIAVNSMGFTLFNLEDLRKITEIAKKTREKPVLAVTLCASDGAAFREIAARSELPIYTDLEDAAKAMNVLRSRGKQIRKFLKD